MKLFYTPTSPYARKIRILLREKGMACEEVQPSLNDAALSAFNPLGKVPTLISDDQTAMFDSAVIGEYLELIQPEPRMLPIDKWERVVVKKWEAMADGICDVLVTLVLELRRARDKQDGSVVDRADHKILMTLRHLDTELTSHRHAHGNEFTLADAALVSAFGYVELRRPQLLQGLQAVRDYAEAHTVRPSVHGTIPPG